MRFFHRLGGVGILLVGTLLVPIAVRSYTGGPIRAHIFGYDPRDSRIYFHLRAHDETAAPPWMYYIPLDGPEPPIAVRAGSHDRRLLGGDYNPTWRDVVPRLVPLESVSAFELALKVESDSVGMHSHWNVPILDLTISATADGETAQLRVEAFCRPLVRVQGLYSIPGRSERLVLFSFVGRPYGCEEIDRLYVLRPD